ncbi:MAG: hypothetical protein SFU56_09535 [Capsulimonadales bacterium]|nr:hypothetical protein [Capsulimonadales bacterium]
MGQEVEFTILLTNTRTHSGIPNKVVRLLFDGQEINREPTDGTGQIRYRYKIPEDTVPATTPNAKPNARQVPLQAIYDGDPQTKKKTLTSRMTVRSRQTYLGGGPSIPNQQYKLEVSDAVFYDANTVVKYYGNVGLEARLTYGDKGVNGKTVTFRIPNRQGKEYTVRVTTEADGYARISLQNVTWLLVADGPWTITASAMGATGSGTLTLQK